MSRPPLIVFTDLDGTLLDHHSYSYSAAMPAIRTLRDRGIPLVLASSKTAAEIAPLRAELGFSDTPAIVENGAGVLKAGADPADDNSAYLKLRQALDALPRNLRQGFEGFGDWTADQVTQHTGLAPQAAALARLRCFSEPGLWTGTDVGRDAFIAALTDAGIVAREGGRFLTLSFGGTKADQMAAIRRDYGNPFAMALGDAPNDIEMLQAADRGIIIANPDRAPLPPLPGEATGQIRRYGAGPEGWRAAVEDMIAELATQ